MRLPASLILAVSFGAVSTATWSEPATETAIPVRIELAADQRADALYDDLQRRARSVCRTHTIRPYDRRALERACREEFLRDAVRAIGRADLLVLHANESEEFELADESGRVQPSN